MAYILISFVILDLPVVEPAAVNEERPMVNQAQAQGYNILINILLYLKHFFFPELHRYRLCQGKIYFV